MPKMTENGLETQRGFENYNHNAEGEICPPKPRISSGNPFLVDLDKSPNHHESIHGQQIQSENQLKLTTETDDGLSTEPGLPASNDVLIDFGVPEALPGLETGGKSNLELLGDFDPIQGPNSSDPDQNVPVSGSDDLKEFMSYGIGGNSDPVEVFAVPPPDPPDGQRRPEEDVVPHPVPEAIVTDRSNAPEVVAAGPCDVISKAEEKPKPGATTEAEKSEVDKNSEQTKAKEDRKLPLPLKTKQPSPRPESGSAEGGMSGKAAKSAAGETGISKPVKTPAAKSPQVSATPRSAIPSLRSPKRTVSGSGSNKGQVDEGRRSLAHSKSISQSDAKARGTSKPRSSSTSAEQPISKTPSPGSTPCSPVSASVDGRESRSMSAVRSARSKIGSLDNKKHTPGGGNVKIQSQKMDLSKVTSKCGSKANMKHNPGGGQKKIENRKLEWKVESKVGSMDNAKHKPGGGDRKIENKKLEWNAAPRVGSLDNAQHKAGGGDKKIETVKLDFKEKAESKIGSKDNVEYKSGGATKRIETQKLECNEATTSKVDSTDDIGHKPEGGDIKVTPESQGVTIK